MIVDSHIHLSHFSYNGEFPYLSFEDSGYVIRRGTREQLIDAFRAAGIGVCVEPGIDIASNGRVLSLAERFPGFLFPAVGVHPTRTFRYGVVQDGKKSSVKLRWKQRRELEQFARHPAVVAIGETGLDYHHPRKEQHRLRQMLWFLYQLKLARRLGLPVILHIRDADADAARILKPVARRLRGGVCHCFSGSAETAAVYTRLGLMLGIGGALLTDGPKTRALEEAVIRTPLESILLETDGPYVRPDCPELPRKQRRRARNTSLILPQVARRIAELKGITPEEVMEVTADNARRLFGPVGMSHGAD